MCPTLPPLEWNIREGRSVRWVGGNAESWEISAPFSTEGAGRWFSYRSSISLETRHHSMAKQKESLSTALLNYPYFPQSLVRTQNCPHASERGCEAYLRFCLGRLPEGIPRIKRKQSYSWELMGIAADPWWSLQHHLNNMQVRSAGRHHTLARQKENRSWILPVANFAIKCQQDTWE